MHRSGCCSLALTAALLLVTSGADAQNVIFNAPGLMPKKAKPGLPDVKARAAAWPRLDPGAVLCRSEADLARLAANRSGAGGGGAADCRVINTPTTIDIVQRAGPGRTQVQVNSPASQVGWTDAWLPEKAPAAGGGAAAR
jgi:hypothetical protein